MNRQTALIIGGGIAGPALALFLKRTGIEPLLYEAHHQAGDIGGALQIAPNGMHVLQELGLASSLIAAGIAVNELCFENQSGKTLGCIENGSVSKYGAPAIQVARSKLHRALLDEVARQGIRLEYDKRLREIAVHPDHVVARFDDGASAVGSFLIGADGIHSRTRATIFPDSPAPSYTGLATIGGFASGPSLRPSSPDHLHRTHMIFGLNGFFGYGYYDAADPSAVMWWSQMRLPEPPARQESPTPEALRQELRNRHREWNPVVADILSHATRIWSGPIYDLPLLPHWHRGRIALIGDAAHAISPHAGQGASLALEDALCLAKRLRALSYDAAFARFQQDRQARVSKIVLEARKRGENKVIPPAAAWIRDGLISLFLRFRGEHMNDDAYGYRVGWEH